MALSLSGRATLRNDMGRPFQADWADMALGLQRRGRRLTCPEARVVSTLVAATFVGPAVLPSGQRLSARQYASALRRRQIDDGAAVMQLPRLPRIFDRLTIPGRRGMPVERIVHLRAVITLV